MALNFQRQIVTSRAPVTAGGLPPSGNTPVFSPNTGGFKPRVHMNGPNEGYIGNYKPTTSGTLPNMSKSPRVGARVGLNPTPKGQPIYSMFQGQSLNNNTIAARTATAELSTSGIGAGGNFNVYEGY